jgi:hypothetical protein
MAVIKHIILRISAVESCTAYMPIRMYCAHAKHMTESSLKILMIFAKNQVVHIALYQLMRK